MPIDPEPAENGNLVKVGTAEHFTNRGTLDILPVVQVLKAGEESGSLQRYISHFATCPDANKLRKRKR